jgi:flagellar biosynthesis/type III secretory pathway M-ring protein FliF/YscJ
MQRVIHLRVLVDYEKDVFRDIEIRPDSSFLDLHNIIQEAFGFDNSQMASFYVSNAEWERGQEITLMEVKEPEEDGEPIWLMNETDISKIVLVADQKLIYVFDFMLMWCFYVDVIAIKEVEDTVILPRITQEFGEAPDQYDKSGEIVFDGVEISSDDDDEVEENELDELFRMMGNEEL